MVHALMAAAEACADKGVTVLPERESDAPATLSYRALYDRARELAAGLRALGVCAGERVLIVLPTSVEFLEVFFAVELLHAIPAPAYPPTPSSLGQGLERLSHIASQAGVRVCVTNELGLSVLADLAHTAERLEHIVTVTSLGGREPIRPSLPRPEQGGFIQYTSGSTGRPKGVLLSHDNLTANVQAIGQAVEVTHDDVVVSWCPLYHDMGLIGTVLFAIYHGVPLVLLSPTAFLLRPRRWLRAISDYRGTLSPAPNFGYALAARRVKPTEREGLDLSSWRVAFNGAEPITRATLEDFLRTYGPYGFRPTTMFPVYGLAESALAVAFPSLGEPPRMCTVSRKALSEGRVVQVPEGPDALTLVGVGYALAGHEVRVVDERDRELGEGFVGEVMTRGPSVMQGYFQNESETRACLRDGWLATGDLGFVLDGCLYIAGRKKDMLIVAGCNYYAEDLERAAETVEGVRKGGVVAFGVYDEAQASDRLVIVAETQAPTSEHAALVRKVHEAVSLHTGLAPAEVLLVPPGTIPKTSSGKRQRKACKQRYLAGRLEKARTTALAAGLLLLRARAGAVRLKTRRLVNKVKESAARMR